MACRSSSSWTGSPLSAHEQTTRVGARSSFAAASGPAASLRRSSASRADHPEAPGVGQVVVGRPAGELEQLSSVPRSPARAGRPCGCGGCGSRSRRPSGKRSRAPAARLSRKAAPVEHPAAPGRSRAISADDQDADQPAPGAAAVAPPSPRWTEAGATGRMRARLAPEGAAGAVAGRPVSPVSPALALAVPARRLGRSRRLWRSLDRRSSAEPASAHGALGTGASGNGLRLTASSAWPVTQTGVWSLDGRVAVVAVARPGAEAR